MTAVDRGRSPIDEMSRPVSIVPPRPRRIDAKASGIACAPPCGNGQPIECATGAEQNRERCRERGTEREYRVGGVTSEQRSRLLGLPNGSGGHGGRKCRQCPEPDSGSRIAGDSEQWAESEIGELVGMFDPIAEEATIGRCIRGQAFGGSIEVFPPHRCAAVVEGVSDRGLGVDPAQAMRFEVERLKER